MGGGEFTGRDRITRGVPASDLDTVFAPLLAAVAQYAPMGTQSIAAKQVQELKTEANKGTAADDSKMGKIVDGLAALVPGAVGAVVSTFSTPILGSIAGPVTKFVLAKLNAS